MDLRRTSMLHATDFVPNSSEAETLRTSIQEDQKQIRDIDVEISHLQVQLDVLCARRTMFIDSSATKEALLAPVRKLPPEVLGAVFILSIQDYVDDFLRGYVYDRAPHRFIRVCKRWHCVALGTPDLWTNIMLKRFTPNSDIIKPMTWMRRSAALPLNITVLDSEFDMEMGQSISENMHRVRNFYYSGDFGLLSRIFRPEGTTNAPFLHTLRIEVGFTRSELGIIYAPNLQTLRTFYGATFIRHLMSDRQFRSFLYLRSIDLTTHSAEEDVALFLNNIYTPSLDNLYLGNYLEVNTNIAPAVRHLLTSSTPPLKRLELQNVQIPPDEMFVDELRHLEVLALSSAGAESFLAALVTDNTVDPSRWAMPNLTTLILNGYQTKPLLIRAVKSRVRSASANDPLLAGYKRLMKLIVYDHDLDNATSEALEKLVQDVTWFSVNLSR